MENKAAGNAAQSEADRGFSGHAAGSEDEACLAGKCSRGGVGQPLPHLPAASASQPTPQEE